MEVIKIPERSCEICGEIVFEKISEKYENPFNYIKIKCLSGHEDEIVQYLPNQA
ncbi:hypothetical protein LCGC14_0454180 [marine sediment metagenome]|uniref:Uncharacterized protein n=1 Tax=marine sediment metagenome TaxID=412755 RepID=A0A0F9VQX0_9ZZZZ